MPYRLPHEPGCRATVAAYLDRVRRAPSPELIPVSIMHERGRRRRAAFVQKNGNLRTGYSVPTTFLVHGRTRLINFRFSTTIAAWHIVPVLSGWARPEDDDHSKRLPRVS